MRTSRHLTTLFLVAGALLGLSACQAVQDDLEHQVFRNSKPRLQVDESTGGEVAIPDLDQRQEDTQFLSKIDRLQKEVFELRNKLKTAEAERDAAVKARDAAMQNESALAELIDEYQSSLASASDMEKKLKDKLLRSQLQCVRYQQTIADLKIRELTKGEGQ